MAYDKIKFKRGLRPHLPNTADMGEPLYCTDTNELFIGTGDGLAPIGVVGPKGDSGASGIDGRDGRDGAIGPRGPEGEKGERGDAGQRGPQGEIGPRGPRGLPGADGINGADGATGERGPIGRTGAKGEQGVQGPAGQRGADGKSITISGTKQNTNQLPSTGSTGDGWLISGDLYVWDDDERTWINVGRIQGPQGEKGDTGARGPAGPVNISDALDSQASNTAASSKAAYTINNRLTQEVTKRILKTGDTMSGSLTFGAAHGVRWDVGRKSQSRIFWNANAQNDYGMQVVVDGQSQFLINKNTRPRTFINGKWHFLTTQEDLENSTSGGDFVGKKMALHYSDRRMIEGNTETITVSAIGKENIFNVCVAGSTNCVATITIDGKVIANQIHCSIVFPYEADTGSYSAHVYSGGFVSFPFNTSISIKIDAVSYQSTRQPSFRFTGYHYYKD